MYGEWIGNVWIVFMVDVDIFVVLYMVVWVFGYFKVYVNGVVGFEIGDVFF